LSELDAEHLFITFDRQEGEDRELLDTPLWRSLPAVRSRCVYEVDFMAWMNYGVLSHQRKIKDVLEVLA
jgi:ABC-type Fe3+-citrate transport system substrate-binding protein